MQCVPIFLCCYEILIPRNVEEIVKNYIFMELKKQAFVQNNYIHSMKRIDNLKLKFKRILNVKNINATCNYFNYPNALHTSNNLQSFTGTCLINLVS